MATEVGAALDYLQDLSLNSNMGTGVIFMAQGEVTEHFRLNLVGFSKNMRHVLEAFPIACKDGAVISILKVKDDRLRPKPS